MPTPTIIAIARKAWITRVNDFDLAVADVVSAIQADHTLIQEAIRLAADDAVRTVRTETRQEYAGKNGNGGKVSTATPAPPVKMGATIPANKNKTPIIITSQQVSYFDYPLQYINKKLGDATPAEIQEVIDRLEKTADGVKRNAAWLREVIKGLNPKQTIRSQYKNDKSIRAAAVKHGAASPTII